jgi:hypothetical protein
MLAGRVFETPALDEINVTECHVKMSRIDRYACETICSLNWDIRS